MKTIEQILSDEDLGPVVKSFVDKRVMQGVQTALAKRPDTSALAARLSRIEEATREQEKKQELKFHVYKKCFENNVDFSLIENENFPDASTAEKRINALAEFALRRKTEEVNYRMTNESFQPKGGQLPTPKRSVQDMSFDEIVNKIQSNTLEL